VQGWQGCRQDGWTVTAIASQSLINFHCLPSGSNSPVGGFQCAGA
jgi:hypothetical protein